MRVKTILRRGLSLLTAFGLMAASLTTNAAAAVTTNPTYRMEPDKPAITAEEIAQGDVTVRVTLYIDNNPGLASVLLTFGVPDGFTFTNGAYSEPYCFGDGSVSSAGSTTTFNSSAKKLLWNSGQNGGVENDLIYDASLPFAEFDVIVPQGTPDGIYPVEFITEPILAGTDANGNPIYTSTAATYRIENKIDIVALTPTYQGCSIIVGDPVVRGDVNQDGAVDNVDAQLILKAYSNTLLGEDDGLTEAQFKNADVDESGAVNSLDGVFVLRYYAAQLIGSGASWEDILKK